MLTGEGAVVSYVVAHRSFNSAFDELVPYVVADVCLDGTDGHVTIKANVRDIGWEEVFVGMPVSVDYDDLTNEISLPVFRPR